MAINDLGRQLSHAVISFGEVRIYERGLTLRSRAGLVEVQFDFPMIGKPEIAADTYTHTLRVVDPAHWAPEEIEVGLGLALRDRLGLLPVGQSSVHMPLAGANEVTASGLENRQLYDIAVNGDAGWQIVAPHAVYARHSWTDFGIVHITDMHVARRIDGFRDILRRHDRHEAAARMYNWNDRFRGFVRYANYLHGIGALDVIVATGDNFDYLFEVGDDPETSGGNAAFLRDLILGKAPGPDFPDVEELRAPIFLIPGNHDYRLHPYALVFDLHVGGGLVGAIDVERIPNFNGYRLSTVDAALITNRGQSAAVPNLGPADAERMVAYDDDDVLRPFRQCLVATPGSYVVQLGIHRIAMIDSAHDYGKPKDIVDAARISLLGGSEDEDAFVGGSPNCRGLTDQAMFDVSKALREADPNGLFIVGLHAPLFNPPFDDYGYFLRETQRPVQPIQTHGLLSRLGMTIAVGQDVLARVEEAYKTWFPDPDGDDNRAPRYVKRESAEEELDHGVSREHAHEIMKVLAGVGSPRAADLVLAGHTHCYNEFRVAKTWNSDELAFYMDFYTQNPTAYYPTTFTRGWRGTPDGLVAVDTAKTYIEVMPDAEASASPWPMPYDALEKYMLQVPPYANPLNAAADPRAWWQAHRPLVLQTGALGPFKKSEFFTGFRVIAVKNDVIDKIHYVSTDRLEKHEYRLDWEQAIQPEGPPRQHRYVEGSRPLGSPPAVGMPSAIAFPPTGSRNVIYRDADGLLHELWRKGAEAGTSDVTTLGDNAMRAAGDPTTYFDGLEGLLVALYRGTDNHVYSLYWSTGRVGRDALSASVDAPRADGKPVGYVGKDGYRHAFYRARDGHLHELWWTGADRPGHGNITPAGAPRATSDPVAYQKPNGEYVVIYRGDDGHIHWLTWLTGTPHHEDLSGFARAPDAHGYPAAYHSANDDVNQIVYRSIDGHIHELYWQGNNPVGHWDLTASTPNAPPAAGDLSGDPISYYSPGDNTKHVIYRSADGHLNDLVWVPGAGAPTWTDLTVFAVAPIAADKPSAFVLAPNTHHVFYRGVDGQIHEIRWSAAVTVNHESWTGMLHLPLS